MRRRSTLLPAVALFCAVLPGCSDYFAVPPNHAVDEVHTGATLRLVTHDGQKLEGDVTAVSDSTFTLVRPGNYGPDERTVSFADLLSLEIQKGSKVGSITAGATGAAATVAVVLVVLFTLAFTFGTVGGN